MQGLYNLEKDGFCIFENRFSSAYLRQLTQHAQLLIQQQSEEEKKKLRSLGSLISLWEDRFFASLITNAHIIRALQSVGANDIRYSNGYLLAKPPHSLATFWHQDWWLWSEQASYTSCIQQIGVLCYLQDVNNNNGALRVIPGSHRQEHSIHRILRQCDNDELRSANKPKSEPYQRQIGELNLELKQGDLVLMDARLLHGANANQSDQYRYGLTLWYYPNYNLFSEAIKARIGSVSLCSNWLGELDKMQPLLPNYKGDAIPERIVNHPQW